MSSVKPGEHDYASRNWLLYQSWNQKFDRRRCLHSTSLQSTWKTLDHISNTLNRVSQTHNKIPYTLNQISQILNHIPSFNPNPDKWH